MKRIFVLFLAILMLLAGILTAAETEKPFEGSMINYVTWRTDDQEVLDYLHQKFYEETGITVNVEYNSGGMEHRSLVSARMQAGACDMFAIDDGAERGPYVKAGSAYEIPEDTAWLENYDDGAIAAGSDGGKIYSIPQCTSTMVFYYDKAYFSELGIEEPKTWDDLLNACAIIKEAGERAPLVMGAGEGWLCANLYYLVYATAEPDTSASFLATLEAGETKLTDAPYQRVANYISEFVKKGYLMEGSDGTDPNVAPNLVINGMAAMSMEGSWRLYAYDVEGFDVGIFIPQIDENSYCVWSNQQNVISSTSEHIDECMLYFEFMSRPENAAYYCNSTAQIPVVKGAIVENEDIAMLTEYIADKIPIQSPKMNAGNSEVYSYIWDFSKGLLSGADPMELAQEIQTNIDVALG